MAKEGRPTKYNQKLAEEICKAISTEGLGLKLLTEKYSHFPDKAQIFKWILKYPEFRDLYTIAKKNQENYMAEDILDIAYTPDYIEDIDTEFKEDGTVIKKHKIFDNVQRSKLKIDALKWNLARLNPQKWGDTSKIIGDANAPITIAVKHLNVDDIKE